MASDSRRARTADTARKPLAQRRMDSLARLVHSYDQGSIRRGDTPNPVATAVGILPRDGKRSQVVVAHNASNSTQRDMDFGRLWGVAQVLWGDRSAREVARELAPTSGLPNTDHGLSPMRRITRDLRKLRKTFHGGDDARGGRELRAALHSAFETGVSYSDRTMSADSGTIHAESALIREGVAGPVGVSKLSCEDCFEYGRGMGRDGDLRGSHGSQFPGWRNPSTGAVSSTRRILNLNQYASDSESDSGAESS